MIANFFQPFQKVCPLSLLVVAQGIEDLDPAHAALLVQRETVPMGNRCPLSHKAGIDAFPVKVRCSRNMRFFSH